MASPDAPPAQDSVVLSAFKGLRNNVTAERLAPDELERARNVDLNDAGQFRRRRGYTKVAEGNFHSLFTSHDGAVYGVRNGALGIIRPDWSFEQIWGGGGSDPIAYVQVGDDIYFSSATVSGIIDAGDTVSDWGAQVAPGEWLSPVINPTDTLAPVAGKLISAPPMATALAYFNGRIYLASGKTVWATELYLYRYIDKTRNYMQFESEVTALGAVTDGLYVGTKSELWFLSGRLGEMRRVRTIDQGVLPGSMLDVPSHLVATQQAVTKNVLLVMTKGGLCVCQDGGNVYNITQPQVLFPDADSAAAMFRAQDGINQYVGVLSSGGSPTSTARIGDYVDAEIRRFQGA